MSDDQISYHLTILNLAVGITAALTFAIFGIVATLSYQLGQIAGALSVLIGHVQLK